LDTTREACHFLEDLEEKEGARKGKEKDVTANFFIAYSFSTSFSIFIFYTGETQF